MLGIITAIVVFKPLINNSNLEKILLDVLDGEYNKALENREKKTFDCVTTDDIIKALGFLPTELYSQRDLYAVVDNEDAVLNYSPDYDKLSRLDKWMGIAITAKGKDCDFVSRFFCPELKLEDPVTGSSHSSLVPLWSEKLNKTELVAKQLSKRGGTLYCKQCKDDIKISGKAVLYLQGELKI